MVIRVLGKPCGVRTAKVQRRREPLTFGAPLPVGAAREPLAWTIAGLDGQPGAVQTQVLDRWLDGSARWVLVDAQQDVSSAGDTELRLETAAQAAAPPWPVAIAVTETPAGVDVDTGVARFTMAPGAQVPFRAVAAAGRPALDPGATGLIVTDARGVTHRAEIASVVVEMAGPLRTVVRLDGRVAAGAGRECRLRMRLHFFAGLATVRLLVTLTNTDRAIHKGGFWDLGDPGSLLVKEVTLRLAPPGADGPVSIRASVEAGEPVVVHDAPFEVYQDSSGGEYWQSTNHLNRERRVPNSFRGYRAQAGGRRSEGLRATPLVLWDRGLDRLGAAVPHFWQNFPMALGADDSSVTIRFLPGQYADFHEIQGGEQKTYECALLFGPHDRSGSALAWANAKTVVSVDPGWVLSSGADPFLAPLGDDHTMLVQSAVDGPDRFEIKRERIDEYGWRHFGEIYGDHEAIRQPVPPLVSHYNNQYDPILGFARQFLRTADPHWWAMATELAAHVVDIDVYHTVRDKWTYNHGLFWHTYHYGDADTATHRTYPARARGRIHGGGPSADHNYTSGLMLMFFLTGEEWARQTVIDLAQFVVDLDDGRLTEFRFLDRGSTGRATLSAGYYGPGRGPANSLNALMDGFRLSGNPNFDAKAEEVLRRVVHPEEDVTRHELDDPERRWFYTMFLQSLGKYLHDKVERGELDDAYTYGRASLITYARWMADHEHPILDEPQKVEFATETWAAQDIRKSDVFCYAALHTSGDLRERFLERAGFFHRYSVETLHKARTRTLARPIIVLLTSGFLLPWVLAHPAVSEPAVGPPATFPPQRSFEPQRARAIRKFMWLSAASAALAVVALLAWLVRR